VEQLDTLKIILQQISRLHQHCDGTSVG